MKVLFIAIVATLLGAGNMVVTENHKIRNPKDSIGFATKPEQIESIVSRIDELYPGEIDFNRKQAGINAQTQIKTIICPHDDYAYAGPVYLSVLKDLKVKTVFLFGVAHKAGVYNMEKKVVFESFDYWKGPYGNIPTSNLRDSIIRKMPEEFFEVHDSLHIVEHSLEALIPFLQYYNRDLEIIPVLVPFSDFETMDKQASKFAEIVFELTKEKEMVWGKDFTIVISNDAVHYGDEGWGGRKYNWYGTDAAGYNKAVGHEYEIIESSLTGDITLEKIKKFIGYTTEKNDYRAYKWTWCGRYSVPFGLLVSHHLAELCKIRPKGKLVKYGTSFELETLDVKDLNMGNTAPSNPNHWVGYAGVVYY